MQMVKSETSFGRREKHAGWVNNEQLLSPTWVAK